MLWRRRFSTTSATLCHLGQPTSSSLSSSCCRIRSTNSSSSFNPLVLPSKPSSTFIIMASSKAHHLTSVTAKPTSIPRNTMLKLHRSIAQSIGAVSRHRGRRKLNPNQTLLIFQCLLQVLIRVPVNLPSPTWRAGSSSHSSWVSSSLIPNLAGPKPRPKSQKVSPFSFPCWHGIFPLLAPTSTVGTLAASPLSSSQASNCPD